MYDVYDLYDVAHVAGWDPYHVHDLGHVSEGLDIYYTHPAQYLIIVA